MPLFPNVVASKLPTIGTSIFSVMSRLATEHKAINLSQGFPDFPCAEALIKLVNKYMRKGYNQYAPMPGLLKLREILAEKTAGLYTTQYDPETEITITAGATQAIYTAITALVKEGDEVIVIEPAYDCYVPAIELCGGKPVYIQLKTPDYNIDWREVQKVITHRTRMMIINTPHNPTGSIMNAEDMAKLEKLTSNTDIIIVSDEVYEHIVFDGQQHQSVARFPKLADRSLIISSFGKTFHATGWKVGYCLAPKNLMAEFRKVHQYQIFSVNTPIQHALAAYLQEKENYIGLGQFYQEKRDYFISQIKDSRFSFKPSAGTYFQLLRYDKLSNVGDTDYAVKLTKEFHIAAIPVSVFYHIPNDNKTLRFCFAKTAETLDKAAEILRSI